MWLYATGADSSQATIIGSAIPNIVLYDYHNSRAGQCTVDFLGGYNGYLQVEVAHYKCDARKWLWIWFIRP